MGVDLTLLPLLSKTFWTAHTQLSLERRRDLWDEFMKLPERSVPEPLHCYFSRGADGESCYGPVESDPYGGSLKWVTAGELVLMKDHEGIRDNPINRGIWAYLAELPSDWPIVLYWH